MTFKTSQAEGWMEVDSFGDYGWAATSGPVRAAHEWDLRHAREEIEPALPRL